MRKNILKELQELTQAGIVPEEIAENIRQYYQAKTQQNSNRLLIVFGILGSLLSGLGIILIIAHSSVNIQNVKFYRGTLMKSF